MNVTPIRFDLNELVDYALTPEWQLRQKLHTVTAELDALAAENERLSGELKQLRAEHGWVLAQLAEAAKAVARGEDPDIQRLAARAIGRHTGNTIHASRPSGRHRKAA